MNRIVLIAMLAAGAAFLSACGVASRGDDGSLHHDLTGVSGVSANYPAGQPTDPESPALGSSTESKVSRDQAAENEKK